MPKRFGNIYPRIECKGNINRAITNAARGKQRKNKAVKSYLKHRAEAIAYTQTEMNGGKYQHPPYIEATIKDGPSQKERNIKKPLFKAQVVHWSLMLQIEPLIMRGMYDWNCGSVPGRGQSLCKRAVERWLRNDPEGTKYCLKLDISKFYPSINADVLKSSFRRVIKCPQTLDLIDSIIDSADGVSIGNYSSQWFANFYLQPADHFIKEKLRYATRRKKNGQIVKTDAIKYFARYVDDMVCFGPNKKKLHEARRKLFDYLQNVLKLKVKDDWQVFLVTAKRTHRSGKRKGEAYFAGRDVDFLGYRMNHNRTIIRKRIAKRMKRKARRIAKKPAPSFRDASTMVSYNGYICHSDSFKFWANAIAPYISIEKMKEMISSAARHNVSGNGKRGTAQTHRRVSRRRSRADHAHRPGDGGSRCGSWRSYRVQIKQIRARMSVSLRTA